MSTLDWRYMSLSPARCKLKYLHAVWLLQGIDIEPNVNFDVVAGKLGGYSGDDITNICRCGCRQILPVWLALHNWAWGTAAERQKTCSSACALTAGTFQAAGWLRCVCLNSMLCTRGLPV